MAAMRSHGARCALSADVASPASSLKNQLVRPLPAARRVARSAAAQRPQQQQQQQLLAQLQHPQKQQQRRPAPAWLARAGSDTAASGSSGAPEGQMSAAIIAAMEAKIKEELQADRVAVADVYGDARHVSIDVVSTAFEGKSSVQRQRMVYKAIWMELQDAVHAVDAMTTKTPQEASA